MSNVNWRLTLFWVLVVSLSFPIGFAAFEWGITSHILDSGRGYAITPAAIAPAAAALAFGLALRLRPPQVFAGAVCAALIGGAVVFGFLMYLLSHANLN